MAKSHPDTPELANGYVEVNATQFNAALFLLKRLGVSHGARVLDVGCGPGNLTEHLASLVGPSGHIVGIDPSAERIALAQRAATPNTTYYKGIAEDLSRFESASFDIVFVNSTLHWVQDQPQALREFARVLVHRGKLGISSGSGDFEADHERIKANVLGREPYRAYLERGGPRFLKRAELEALLDDAGFGARDIVVNTIVKAARDADEMIHWLDTSSSGQTYGGIPLELRPKARDEMKAEWERITTKDGIRMEMELLVTVAIKG